MFGLTIFVAWYVGAVVTLVRESDDQPSAVVAGIRALLWPLLVVGRAADVLMLPPGDSP